jgi:hypothetical protein
MRFANHTNLPFRTQYSGAFCIANASIWYIHAYARGGEAELWMTSGEEQGAGCKKNEIMCLDTPALEAFAK